MKLERPGEIGVVLNYKKMGSKAGCWAQGAGVSGPHGEVVVD